MVKLGLKPLKRNKRKYSSYKGTVGKIAENHIKREFYANKPNKKWYTDVTEFNLRGEKCYLSPILDGFNGEVISYNISKSPHIHYTNFCAFLQHHIKYIAITQIVIARNTPTAIIIRFLIVALSSCCRSTASSVGRTSS